ncbi:MAG: SAM-dependent methyltransferase [Legionellaceae bacterium]|nr:SAM-dependent methyltransferase [Legionellaceae bacterium]
MNLVKTEIKNKGPITFADFMQIALYNPESGYYSSGMENIGASGDFTTAPEISYLFGYALANQCRDVLKHCDNGVIFEFGAGSGKLCVDILTKLENLQSLPDRYYILEVSGNLKRRQQQFIEKSIPHLSGKVVWLEKWPEEPFQGVILANEILDAMPVNRFIKNEESLYEIHISLNDNDELVETAEPCINNRLKKHVATYVADELSPYKSEVNLFMDDWIAEIYGMLEVGAVFILDYGFPTHEYYHPDRSEGTIMCHYQHKAHPNPLLHIGEQDISAHVNFTHLAEAAFNVGFRVAGYTNQASFLLGNDILELLQNSEDESVNTKQNLKTLLLPSEMGELFKVIGLTKQLDIDLSGFKLNDKRASL